MRLQYLGTGASEGFPALFCDCEACRKALESGGKNIKMRSCALLDDKLLIDLSPDLYAQKLRFNLSLSHVRSVVITHSHEDHFDVFSLMLRGKDMASIINLNAGGVPVVEVYGNNKVQSMFNQAIATKLKGRGGRFDFHKVVPFMKFETDGFQFTPLPANHKEDEECLIYSIEKKGRRILYANDTGALSPSTFEVLRGIVHDVVSMDCSRGILPGDSHMGLQENVAMREMLISLGCVDENTRFILNHLSHMSGLAPYEFDEIARQHGFIIAFDGMIVDV